VGLPRSLDQDVALHRIASTHFATSLQELLTRVLTRQASMAFEAQNRSRFVLTMRHCIAFRCLMNSSIHQEERDARPLYLCPVCQRKLCWNVRVEPVAYLTKLKAFCQQNGLDPESAWYEKAVAAWATDRE
jgi:hypothetical protein